MASQQSTSRVLCCFITSLLFVIIVPTLWINLVLKLTTNSGVPDNNGNSDYITRTIVLQAGVVSADIPHTTVVVDWEIIWDTCRSYGIINCTDVNIFFDMNLSPSDPRYNNGPGSNNRVTDPIFIWNATVIQAELITFRTELVLLMDGEDSYLTAYPFDSYYAFITAFAQEALTNNSVDTDLATSIGLIS
ncbi:hypothetical protein EV421DRAFT_137318 [Armillaria borealis]|uniref:Uncharacterized protein n=1 Tax=Armillaria borealis TaxID=47425 RepID=A0AA39IWH5_9AGAR|nr:hypothetical protein EV421DRAFT_137318 [Armillaria borealis]